MSPLWCLSVTRAPGCRHFLCWCWTSSQSSGLQKYAKRMSIPTQYAAHVPEERKKDPTSNIFDDDERIRSFTEAQAITADIPEDRLNHDQSAADPKKRSDPSRWESFCERIFRGASSHAAKEKLRLSRQQRVNSELARREEPKPLAIFHQLIFDEWAPGTTVTPLARTKVVEKNCYGMIEWSAVRKAASSLLPKHAAVAGWKNRALSCVEHEGVQPMPKKSWRDSKVTVDCPLECSLALGMVAAEARLCVAEQTSRLNPLLGSAHDSLHERHLQEEQHNRMHQIRNFQVGGPGKLVEADDPRHALQENGGLADQWYLDDGDTFCHPLLVQQNLQAFDAANG